MSFKFNPFTANLDKVTPLGGEPEGTSVKSTGEAITKFLRADGDGTSSWQTPAGGGDLVAANNLSDVANAGTSRTNLGLAIGTDVLAEQTIGIADNNLVEIDSATVADNEYARFTANGLESRSTAEVLSDIGAAPALGADDNYVTDAEKTVIGNTSGTNTGDNTVCTSGEATTAETLKTARTIAGVSFNGSANISLNNNAITNGAGYTTNTGDMVLASIQSVTGLKTFDTTKIAVKGSSTGTTSIASANSSATDYTATLQAGTGTIAYTSDITGTNSGTNTGDQTTIAGITGTKAQFDTAVTDGNITYDGDAPTAHSASHLVSGADTVFPADPGTDKFLMWDDDPGELVWATPAGSGDLLADGTVPLTANWDVGAYTITGTQFISDIAIGTAPLVVTSTTMVDNLNADLLDGNEASAFATALGADDNYVTDAEKIVIGNTSGANTGDDPGLENVVEDATPQLGGDLDLNEHYLQLEPSPASDHTASGLMASETVDANTYGIASALHRHTDGDFIEADADAATTMPCHALALETGTGTKKVLLQGYIRDDTWNWTLGAPIYVSTTVGTLTQTAPSGSGDQVQIVGHAVSADIMYFDPSPDLIELT